jgi:hypothetical protein
LLFTSCQRVFQSRLSVLRWHELRKQIRKSRNVEGLGGHFRRNHVNDLRKNSRGIEFDQVSAVPVNWNMVSFLMEELLKAKKLTPQ